jgi:signal transduction histidine kinase
VSDRPISETPLPPSPNDELKRQLLAIADEQQTGGDPARARQLQVLVASWWDDLARWEARLAQLLGVHHEINNALVGVRGNAQLLLMDPTVQSPVVREKLEVLLRESGRIRDAAARLRELKAALHGPGSSSRAA